MSKFNFQKVIDNIEQVKRELPTLLANDAQTFFLANFRDEGFGGEKWPEVKRRMGPGSEGGGEKGTPEWRYPKDTDTARRTKKILISHGTLRGEVRLVARNAKVDYDKYNFWIRLALDDGQVPYGKYLNEGTEHMPARPFMKDHPQLRRILRARVERYFDKVWK